MSVVLNKNLALSASFQARTDIAVPRKEFFDLPEKVIQFGSGVLLRGFTDFFIDKANHQGIFNGRVIVVQSTAKGKSDALNQQEGLYTVCEQGLEEGQAVERYSVLASISRAISATDDWQEVLQCAAIPTLELIVSNTTEVGLVYDADDSARFTPPNSFPAKLARFLFERFQKFPEKGFVIIPTELVENNGDKLRDYVLKHSEKANFGDAFAEWLLKHNRFCNSLVDRIVPGKPDETKQKKMEAKLGYRDDLLICAELYSLWAIEGDAMVEQACSFREAVPRVIITKNITPYRERKLRILNGAHTISVATAFLSGKNTVLEMMNDSTTGEFIERVVYDEIVPSLDVDQTKEFAADVLARFRNPFLKHNLLDITFQYTSKFKTRVLPIVRKFNEKQGRLPKRIVFGFAAYLNFMRGVEEENNIVYGKRDVQRYAINDEHALYFFKQWKDVDVIDAANVSRFVKAVCSNQDLWGMNLDGFADFSITVSNHLNAILRHGAAAALKEING